MIQKEEGRAQKGKETKSYSVDNNLVHNCGRIVMLYA